MSNWYNDGYDPCYSCPFYGKFGSTCNNCDQDIERINDELFDHECDKADDDYYKNK